MKSLKPSTEIKGTWRQSKGFRFEGYGHEIFLVSGVKYKGNSRNFSKWIMNDATKPYQDGHADFETNDRQFEFKFNKYYLKPCHFWNDIFPRFFGKKQKTLVVLDKTKCNAILELLRIAKTELWDLKDLRQHYPCKTPILQLYNRESNANSTDSYYSDGVKCIPVHDKAIGGSDFRVSRSENEKKKNDSLFMSLRRIERGVTSWLRDSGLTFI